MPFLQVESGDLIAYGLIPEFVGRFPILVSLSSLSEDQLVEVILPCLYHLPVTVSAPFWVWFLRYRPYVLFVAPIRVHLHSILPLALYPRAFLMKLFVQSWSIAHLHCWIFLDLCHMYHNLERKPGTMLTCWGMQCLQGSVSNYTLITVLTVHLYRMSKWVLYTSLVRAWKHMEILFAKIKILYNHNPLQKKNSRPLGEWPPPRFDWKERSFLFPRVEKRPRTPAI